MKAAKPKSDTFIDLVYDRLKAMAINFDLRPGERLNEGELAKLLGVSRTPVREALSRLSTEGLIRFVRGKGFFCRELSAKEVFDLYEFRKSLEVMALRLSVVRASDRDIDALSDFLRKTGPEPGDRSIKELVTLDEFFHVELMRMSGNEEMLRLLHNVTERIRFVRWIDMEQGDRTKTQIEHRKVLQALKKRDEKACVSILESHIDRRMDQIVSAIKEGFAQIYMQHAPASSASNVRL